MLNCSFGTPIFINYGPILQNNKIEGPKLQLSQTVNIKKKIGHDYH
jgi:hypothetical protein